MFKLLSLTDKFQLKLKQQQDSVEFLQWLVNDIIVKAFKKSENVVSDLELKLHQICFVQSQVGFKCIKNIQTNTNDTKQCDYESKKTIENDCILKLIIPQQMYDEILKPQTSNKNYRHCKNVFKTQFSKILNHTFSQIIDDSFQECLQCKSKSSMVYELKLIGNPPIYLNMYVPIFTMDQEKLRLISYPNLAIDMPFQADKEVFFIEYFIIGIIYHIGNTLQGGHYITQILQNQQEIGKCISNTFDAINKKRKLHQIENEKQKLLNMNLNWNIYDDENIIQLNTNEAIKEKTLESNIVQMNKNRKALLTPYIFIYKRFDQFT